ncbi:MAG: sialidase family protein, partial [Bacteroidales bacterium]|nr:sialidase family protein [Bacteroidales bacterium]
KKGELTYKWNWNAPFIISPHSNKRLYIAANKIFRSDDRGQSWTAISDDLTAQIDRNSWPVMGKYWSSDAVVKDVSTSLYGMVVSFAESPKKEGLLYAGTDDGLIQVTDNGGSLWSKTASFPGVPANTYVSDICPSNFDENIVFASFDNRKRDDFKPYLLKSTNKGKSWVSIANDLPANGTVHTIVQDFKNPDLLFAGTEFGVYFSYNGGTNWIQLKSGIPTIAVRDMAIQQRENDLVLATFGRGFYILDDYSALRDINESLNQTESKIFPVKDALAYVQTGNKYGQGATYYLAKNPDFGAIFTYYLKESPKSTKKIRHEKEKELFKDGKPIPQLTFEAERKEKLEEPSYLVFTIKDESGSIIRKLTAKPAEGISRISWDLRYASIREERGQIEKFDPTKEGRGGIFVMPGKYSVSLALFDTGIFKELVGDQSFVVKQLNNTTLPAPDRKELLDFQKKVADRVKTLNATRNFADDLYKKVLTIKQTIVDLPEANTELMKEVQRIEKEINDIIYAFDGPEAKASFEEIPPHDLALNERLQYLMYTHYNATSAITQTEKEQLAIVEEQAPGLISRLKKLSSEDIVKIEKELDQLKAPYTPGRLPEWK